MEAGRGLAAAGRRRRDGGWEEERGWEKSKGRGWKEKDGEDGDKEGEEKEIRMGEGEREAAHALVRGLVRAISSRLMLSTVIKDPRDL